MDDNQKLEKARHQAATLQKQLAEVRAQGGSPDIEARLEGELAQVYQLIGNPIPAGPPPGSPYLPQSYGHQVRGNYEESKATMILVFGILSIVVCQFFGPFAWSMGNTELRRVDQGLVDPRDRGSIQAGRICGIVGSVLMILWVLAVVGFYVAFATASRQHY